MQWYDEADHTRPVFTAEQHIGRKFPDGMPKLPRRAVAFCLGRGLPVLQERFETSVLMEELAGFITHTPVLAVKGRDDVCFLDGGRGAPQAVCVVESLHALGVEELLVVGLCGAFGADIQVCDVLVPGRLLIEEGSSQHYFASPEYAVPGGPLKELAAYLASRGFNVKPADTVTTDAPYRQTFYKEALWRERGCAGVDMEASAMVSVCNYYGMKSAVALMASDKHPLDESAPPWAWGNMDFKARQNDFIAACSEFM